MKGNQNKEIEDTERTSRDITICPFLGFWGDSETAVSYPSQANCCHRAKPVHPVNFHQQQLYCLSEEHIQCSVYQKVDIEPLPRKMRLKQSTALQSKPWLPWVGLLIVAVLGLFASYFLGIINISALDGVSIINSVPEVQPEVYYTRTPLQPTATETLLPTITPTRIPPTITPTLEPFMSLETQIGTNPPLMIHRLADGEGVNLLATLYDTTSEAIKAVNYNLPPVLWVNSVIVIPVGTKDVTGLPAFSTHEVEQVRITIEEFAALYKYDLTLLMKYNYLPDGYILKRGEWLLIPQT